MGQDLEVLEREADKIAAINASPQVVFAGWQFFRTGYAGLSHESYRQPQLRAKRICEFAQQVGNWIGPAKIVVPRVSTDIPKNGTAMAFPCFSGAPNVIDEFVIVKCEIRRDVPVPPR